MFEPFATSPRSESVSRKDKRANPGRQSAANESKPIVVQPATEDRFHDLRALLEPKSGNPNACWCLTYRVSGAENSALRGEARAARMLQLCQQRPAPGLLAYREETPVGWCAVGPRSSFERLNRSRTIPKLDDKPVWSVVCLVVRSGFRGQGVARALVAAAVDHATRAGAPALEGYPIESDGRRVSSTLAFTGTTDIFGAAGFTCCASTSAKSAGRPRVIMHRALNETPG
jgi:GNAT superfamily N-acetyltransferase